MKRLALYATVAMPLVVLVALNLNTLTAQSPPEVLCLGDSSLFTSLDPVYGFPTELQKHLAGKATVTQGGCAGNDVLSMVGLYHLKYEDRAPDIVVIRIGWNDQFRMDWAAGPFAPRLTQFVREMQAKGAHVFIVKWEAPAIRDDVKWGDTPQSVIVERNAAVNTQLAEICKATGAEFVEAGLLKSDFNADDPVHPNTAGSKRIAEALAARILPHLN